MSEKKWFSTLFNRNSASSEAKSVATEEQLKQEKNKKLKAAYALNLCTVSVSQIIDYKQYRYFFPYFWRQLVFSQRSNKYYKFRRRIQKTDSTI